MNESIRPREAGILKGVPWLPWVVGTAACAALVLGVIYRTEEREFLHLAKRIEPGLLGLALVLQSTTYLTQGLVWRMTARAAGHPLTLGKSYQLSLASLFVDQAIPTAGISGMSMASGALARTGMPAPAVAAAILVNLSMYYLAYAACMALALGIALPRGQLPGWLMLPMLAFVLVRLGMAWFVIAPPQGAGGRLRQRLRRSRTSGRVLDFFANADRAPFRDRGLLVRTCALHGATFLLDAATLWVAVLALGESAPVGGLFASFMISTFFRTIGIMPGGLGSFEAASVLSLKSIGLPLPLALSATLLFRGLSFWLPMIPGLICSRRLLGGAPAVDS
jgi:Mg2+-importing ATPase